MSHHSPFTTFDLKEKKLQLVFIVVLILLLPLLLYALQLALSLRSRAAGETRFVLIPKNVAQAPNGTWRFTKDQEVEVDVVLESGSNQIESIEPVIFYDKNILTLKSTNPNNLSTENIFCSDFTPLKHKVAAVVGGLQIDQNGVEQGTEFGFASIACTIYPSSDPDAAETPPPVGFSAPIATFKFTPKTVATGQTITFDFSPGGGQNDSTAYKYEGGCCSQTNVLQLVENLTYDVIEAQQDATLALSPSSDSFAINQQFQVQVNLSSGQYSVDAVDAIIDYDDEALELVEVEEGTIFPSYVTSPDTPAGATGRISIGGQVNPGSPQGFSGNNQLFATLTFKALKQGTTNVTFYIDEESPRNDTNISQFRQGVDVLSGVVNAQYSIVGAVTPTPTIPVASPTPNPFPAELKLTPDGGNHIVGQPFTVAVSLTTGPDRVDSVDAIVSYDRRYLQIVSVTQNSVFESESSHQSDPTDSDNIRTVTLVHQVSPNSTGVTGTDLALGTITFQPLQVVGQTQVNVVFTGAADRNDSNVVKFRSSTDLLGKVTLANFGILTGTNNLVERIRFKIALQGRSENDQSKQIDLKVKIGEYFEQNPIVTETDENGEVELANELQNRIEKRWYSMLIKPQSYLQQRVNATFDNDDNVVDITNRPFKAGDLDDSGYINSFDWTKYLAVFNTADPIADIDGSGLVNSLDNTYILLNWFGEDEQ